MISIHLALLVSVIVEIFGLEISPTGGLHHLVDLGVILSYGFCTGTILRSRWVGATVCMVGLVPWVLDLVDYANPSINVESIGWFLLHATVAWTMIRDLLRRTAIRNQELTDALSVYLLVGIAFANLYSIVLWVMPGSIRAQGPAGPSYAEVLYYSFMTQLSVGFGDVTPAHNLTRLLSVLQGLFGVLYVAVLIARFVSLHTSDKIDAGKP